MREKKEAVTPRRFRLRRVLAVILVIALSAGILSISVFAKNAYIITDGDNVKVHISYSSDPEQILDEAGFQLGEEDTYTTSCSDGINQITINRIQLITVNNQGSETVVGSYGETVGELLSRLGIALTEDDTLSCDSDTCTFDGMYVEIIRSEVRTLTYEEEVPFETLTYESEELLGDEQQLLSSGQNGLTRYTAEVTYENGVEVSRTILSSQVVTPMVPEVVLCSIGRSTRIQEGANGGNTSFLQTVPDEDEDWDSGVSLQAPSGGSDTSYGSSGSYGGGTSSGSSGGSSSGGNTFTTASGDVVSYSRKLTCTATGYSCEGYTGYTYTGTVARVGAIAVDPTVIPLGSRLYIVTNDGYCVYGYCVAEDIGGAIKGNKVDLYFNTVAECYAFGYRTCTVYVLD